MVIVSRVLGKIDKAKYLSYIQSNGAQWIDTGIKGNQNTRVTMTVSISDHAGCGLFGARKSVGNQAMNLFNYTGRIRVDYASTSGTYINRSADKQIDIDFNQNVVTVDGNSVTCTAGTFTTPVNLYLFTVNTDGTAYDPAVTMKLYSCQIRDNGILVRDFRPAKDKNGVVCLYDEVTKAYFYNIGNGSFSEPS